MACGECGDHAGAGDAVEDGGAEKVAGVIIEPVEYLDVAAVGQVPVGEVRLPALVGLGCLEAVVGAARPLLRLGCDQAGSVQDPSDRGGGRDRQPALVEVPGDGQGASRLV
jgi:hypothetical protein